MIILKSEVFNSRQGLTKYVNENNIKREDIVSIVIEASIDQLTLFFYGDSQAKEVTHGFFS